MQASEVELNGRFMALETLLSTANRQVVMLSGTVALQASEISALQAEIDALQKKLKAKQPKAE